jgi:PTS system fructose-specific IIC component
MLATSVGAGFFGGLVSGFLAGYVTLLLNKYIKLPKNLQGLMPVLILPLLSTLIVGLSLVYLIGPPMKIINDAMTNWLMGLQTGSAAVLGLILGAMMAFDMGGPVNKAAYAFSVGLLASQIYEPMAAVMAAGMTPPLGLALATVLFKNRFTAEEREAGSAAAVLGIAFITEGAIPFAARDPLRTVPCLMIGSAVAGALSMIFHCELMVPHGGIFVLPIPNAVDNLAIMDVILAGTPVTTGMLFLLKKPLARKEQAFAKEVAVA